MKSGQYRADIDGLRFLAVVPVVLFHAGFSGFSGGFVGVDVFFVISGYLITRIIVGEADQGKFSIVRFYERRVRRIFPALFALIAFVCLAAPTALLPSELRTLPYEVVGALAFVANIVFWLQSDYFDPSAEQKPLLHTWSLGVEEQFYIFAPLILWLVVRYARSWLRPVLLAALAVSLALCIYITPTKSSAAFYLLPFRAWELLVGSVLAIGLPRLRSARVNEGLSALGIAFLLLAIFGYDKNTAFPGYAAALPVIGSALIIQFAEGTRVGRLLASRPLVFIGLISYSLYLWHWPLIVFFRDWGLLETLLGRAAVVCLSLAAAWLSWKFVETPFRSPANWPRQRLFRFAGIGSAVLAAAAGGLYLTDGWPSRFSAENIAFDMGRHDNSPERSRCHIGKGERPFSELCRLGASDRAEPDTIVWADSHGVELAEALAEGGLPVIQATYSACPPALNFNGYRGLSCKQHNDNLLQAIMHSGQIRTVVIAAYYAHYSSPQFWAGMRDTTARLKAAGKTVVIIGPAPNFGVTVPDYLASGHRAALTTAPVPPEFDQYLPGTNVISVRDRFCRAGTCAPIVNGKPLLFDDNHLSMTAMRSITGDLIRQIRSAR